VVSPQSDADCLTVEVRDDGRGFAVQTAAQSGLRGLRDRIEALGGRMEITSAAIGESLHLSESAIEKYVNAIFVKLGLSDERKISRRVVAVLAYLRDPDRCGRD
jgi:signal transduction histidine kinase